MHGNIMGLLKPSGPHGSGESSERTGARDWEEDQCKQCGAWIRQGVEGTESARFVPKCESDIQAARQPRQSASFVEQFSPVDSLSLPLVLGVRRIACQQEHYRAAGWRSCCPPKDVFTQQREMEESMTKERSNSLNINRANKYHIHIIVVSTYGMLSYHMVCNVT